EEYIGRTTELASAIEDVLAADDELRQALASHCVISDRSSAVSNSVAAQEPAANLVALHLTMLAVFVFAIAVSVSISRRPTALSNPNDLDAGSAASPMAMPPFDPAPVPAVVPRPPAGLAAGASNPIPPSPSRYPRLLTALLGDREKAERLIDYERRFKPGASREALVDAALARLSSDNRRS